MTHIASESAVMFSAFAVANSLPSGFDDTEKSYYDAFRTSSGVTSLEQIRDMPPSGTPANIVQVPVYGEAQSFSVGAQPDSSDLEFTVNLVPEKWNAAGGSGAEFRGMVGDGVERPMAFYYLNSRVNNPVTTPASLGQKPNTIQFFRGRVESVLYNPMRDDAATATVTLAQTSPDWYGLYTINSEIAQAQLITDNLDSFFATAARSLGSSGDTAAFTDGIKFVYHDDFPEYQYEVVSNNQSELQSDASRTAMSANSGFTLTRSATASAGSTYSLTLNVYRGAGREALLTYVGRITLS